VGVMRFEVHPAATLTELPDPFRAFLGGFDGRIFPTRIEVAENMIICRRNQPDSAKLHISWPVKGFGTPVVNTAQLREREEPYILPLELARGKITSIRNQHSAWELAGMHIPDAFLEQRRMAHHCFRKAVVSTDDPDKCAASANQALVHAFSAAEILTKSYVEQRLAVRRQRASSLLPVSMGCGLGSVAPGPELVADFCGAFNAAIVPVEWRRIEGVEGEYQWDLHDAQVDWCEANRLLMVGGPLLDLSVGGIPEWLKTWSNDVLNLQSFVTDFVETAMSRYLGRIRHWEVVARCNTGGALELSEENRLSLVARVLEAARQVDDETRISIRVDQPWGDYQSVGQHRLSPLQFVDALVRSGVGLSGVNLEVAIGYRPDGSASRDLHDFSRMLDRWSCLGIPLSLTLAFPSQRVSGPNGASRTVNCWKDEHSEAAQAAWVDLYLPLLMAKDSIVGVFWHRLQDNGSGRYPGSALWRESGEARQALQSIVKCQAFWESSR
jgi:hypothetical protein